MDASAMLQSSNLKRIDPYHFSGGAAYPRISFFEGSSLHPRSPFRAGHFILGLHFSSGAASSSSELLHPRIFTVPVPCMNWGGVDFRMSAKISSCTTGRAHIASALCEFCYLLSDRFHDRPAVSSAAPVAGAGHHPLERVHICKI